MKDRVAPRSNPPDDHPTAAKIGRNIRWWRKHRKLSKKEVALELGFSLPTWGHWESGERLPSVRNLLRAARMLKIPPCALIAESPEACASCLSVRNYQA